MASECYGEVQPWLGLIGLLWGWGLLIRSSFKGVEIFRGITLQQVVAAMGACEIQVTLGQRIRPKPYF